MTERFKCGVCGFHPSRPIPKESYPVNCPICYSVTHADGSVVRAPGSEKWKDVTIGRSAPKYGVGTVLKEMFESFGVESFQGCGCARVEALMNQLGPDGCRDKLKEIVEQIYKNAKRNRRQFPRRVRIMLRSERAASVVLKRMILTAIRRYVETQQR